MPGVLICFNCKSRGTTCVSQSGDGSPTGLQLRRHPESPSTSSSENPDLGVRDSSVLETAADALENSVTDERAPFLAVLDQSGVSLPGWLWLCVQQV